MRRLTAALCLIGYVIGLLAWWPLALLCLLGLAALRFYITPLALSLLLDVWYGAPPAYAHPFPIPFTLAVLVAILVRVSTSRYVRRRGRGDYM